MKNCPICGASCFDDMEVCYGCLHSFEERRDGSLRPSEEMSEALADSKSMRFSFGNNREERRNRREAKPQAPVEDKGRTDCVKPTAEIVKDGKDQDRWVVRVKIPPDCKSVSMSFE